MKFFIDTANLEQIREAYALAKNDTRCFVYEFNPRGFNYSDNASFNGYYTINIPQGLDESADFYQKRTADGRRAVKTKRQ